MGVAVVDESGGVGEATMLLSLVGLSVEVEWTLRWVLWVVAEDEEEWTEVEVQ